MSIPLDEAPRGDAWLSARASALSDELHGALAATGDDACWLVYDPVLHPLADDADASAWLQAGPAPLEVPIVHPQVDRAVWPLWMRLDTSTGHGSGALQASLHASLAELQPEALQQGQGRRLAGWLQLHEGCDPTQAALQSGRAMLQRPPRRGTVLLRLHDPAVRWVLWPLLDARQQAAALGQVWRWWALDPIGRAWKIEGSAPSNEPLTLRPDQWLDVERIEPLNRALVQWLQDQRSVWLAPEALEQARDQALAALRRAHLHGLNDAQDLAAFASHALNVHASFDEHPRVHDLLRQRQEHGEHYTAVMEALTADDWLAVAADLAQRAPG